jgi:hypothetical protein
MFPISPFKTRALILMFTVGLELLISVAIKVVSWGSLILMLWHSLVFNTTSFKFANIRYVCERPHGKKKKAVCDSVAECSGLTVLRSQTIAVRIFLILFSGRGFEPNK